MKIIIIKLGCFKVIAKSMTTKSAKLKLWIR